MSASTDKPSSTDKPVDDATFKAQFKEREIEIMSKALLCLKSGPPEVDFDKLAPLLGMTNIGSARNAWNALKKKIFTDEPGSAVTTPAKRGGGRKAKPAAAAAAGDGDGDEAEDTPKLASATPSKRKKAATASDAAKKDGDGEGSPKKKRGKAAAAKAKVEEEPREDTPQVAASEATTEIIKAPSVANDEEMAEEEI